MTKQPTESVGVIGLGAMGAPIARRLLAAGLHVVVHDRRGAAVQQLVGVGARDAT